jgi:hypothetical protein
MVRKQRSTRNDVRVAGSCAVCGMRDARALVEVELDSERVVLCGSHEIMQRRDGRAAKTAAELRALFADRRETDRRGRGDVDELAASLTAAFSGDRRVAERRTG